ncbi:ParB/Srx family N-terminal domain-containing protein [Frankia tisae]|uniref:ParB/Srx family N-terminal domain-containing protein n=1 Tax=Frankia tisae TaxID=2950104 RepID=UPI0021C0FEF2|nr:ParB/Srx family N-terminal domain-containing protein [Frankia tisae]
MANNRESKIFLTEAAESAADGVERVGNKIAEVQEKTSMLAKASIEAVQSADGAGEQGLRSLESEIPAVTGGSATPKPANGTPGPSGIEVPSPGPAVPGSPGTVPSTSGGRVLSASGAPRLSAVGTSTTDVVEGARLPASASTPASGAVVPAKLRFSQENIGSKTRDGTPVRSLADSMRSDGWQGNPIDAVQYPDGSLTSIDNRRLWAAHQAGLPDVPIRQHLPSEPFPAKRALSSSFTLPADIRQVGPDTYVLGGQEGTIVFRKGAHPRTWGQAALFRAVRQDSLPDGSPFPISGRYDLPRILGR